MALLDQISTYFLIIWFIDTIAYLIGVTITVRTYFRYRYIGHALLALSFVSFFISNTIRFLIKLFAQEYILLMWFISNVVLMFAFWAMIIASFIIQYDDLPYQSHIITLVVGAIIGFLADDDQITIINDEFGINATYGTELIILSFVLIATAVVFMMRPLILKIRKNPSSIGQANVLLLTLSYVLLTLWAVTITFASNNIIRNTRPLILALGVLFWGLSLWINPLTVAFTSTKVKMIIISNRSGIPLLSLDLQQRKEVDSTLIMGLLSALKSSMEVFIKPGTLLNTIILQDSLVTFFTGNKVVLVMVLDGNLSSNLELLGLFYIREFEEKYSSNLDNSHIIYTDEYARENDRIFKLVESMTA